MDLYAYSQIEKLKEKLDSIGINIPRLRGLRDMKEETRVSEEEIEKAIKESEISVIQELIAAVPSWSAHPRFRVWTLGEDEKKYKRYLLSDGEGNCVGIKWENIKGRRKKIAKILIKHEAKKVREYFETFNKYVGRDDVLYVHARIGGYNWIPYGGLEIKEHPVFIEKIDDIWDSTYCNIYLRINKD